MLLRGDRLLDARDYRARAPNTQSLVPQLSGAEQEQARVRVGAADYLRGDAAAACQYLQVAAGVGIGRPTRSGSTTWPNAPPRRTTTTG